MSHEFTAFSVGPRVYRIDGERFQIQTSSGPSSTICEIAAKIFGELLVHTPVSAVGINRDVHFQVSGREKRDEIRRSLAPLDPWGDLGKRIDFSKNAEGADGLSSISMQYRDEAEDCNLRVSVTLEPSVKFTSDGIYMSVNFHHTFESERFVHDTSHAIEVLKGSFSDRMNDAESIFDTIMRM